MRAVHPGSRVPLARTSRRPAQAHRGGGLAPAHRGGTHPLTRTGGPRGRCPSMDPRAPAGPHIHCAPVARVRPLTPTRRRPLQSPQHHATPTGGWAGARQGPPQSAGGGRPGPGGGRGGGGKKSARCRTVRPGGQCEGLPQRDRPPGRPRPERSGSPYVAPGNAPDRERRPAGAHQPGSGPLWALDGVARVQSIGPAPVHGGRPPADGSGVCHVPPQ